MKTQGLRAIVATALVGLLVLGGASMAHAGDRPSPTVSFEFDNDYPTPLDEITMTIHFALADGCYTVDEGQPVDVDQHTFSVKIEATEVPGPCPGPTDETFHRIIGPLSAGSYDIGAEVNVEYLCQSQLCESVSTALSGTVQVASVGDANCDMSINSIDANIVLQQSAQLSNAACPQGADANRDGYIQATDATVILQYTAGLLAQLPPPG